MPEKDKGHDRHHHASEKKFPSRARPCPLLEPQESPSASNLPGFQGGPKRGPRLGARPKTAGQALSFTGLTERILDFCAEVARLKWALVLWIAGTRIRLAAAKPETPCLASTRLTHHDEGGYGQERRDQRPGCRWRRYPHHRCFQSFVETAHRGLAEQSRRAPSGKAIWKTP